MIQIFLQNLLMYNLPGYDPINEKDIRRYIESNDNLLKNLAKLIEGGLKHDDLDIHRMSALIISLLPENERVHFLAIVLNDEKNNVRGIVASTIQFVPKNERAHLLEIALKDDNKKVRVEALLVLYFVSKSEREYLLEKLGIIMNILEELATKTTPLYGEKEKIFFRKGFEKAGSRKTLLNSISGKGNNSLKEKVIIRHIELYRYLMWKKAFESFDVWKEMGFSYIPIEPIIRIGKNVNNLEEVDVFTRVLCGPSVVQWKQKSILFLDKINEQIERITKGLEKLGVNHNDLYDRNFVLLFGKTDDGRVDFSKPSGVYVIDFELSTLRNNI